MLSGKESKFRGKNKQVEFKHSRGEVNSISQLVKYYYFLTKCFHTRSPEVPRAWRCPAPLVGAS